MLLLIAIGLAVAGIIMETAAFYWLAGAVAAVQVLLFMVALVGFNKVSKKIDREFSSFDSQFGLRTGDRRYRR